MNRLFLPKLICCLLMLAACDGARQPQPLLISSAPFTAPETRHPPSPWTMEKSLSLDVAVADLPAALASAARVAADLDGYVTYYSGDSDTASMTLLVPTYREAEALRRVRLLGTVNSETILHRTTTNSGSPGPHYTNINLKMWESYSQPPHPASSAWRPGETAARAFAVFMSIFRVIADTVIWIVVVVGPFALVAAFGYWLISRYLERRRP